MKKYIKLKPFDSLTWEFSENLVKKKKEEKI